MSVKLPTTAPVLQQFWAIAFRHAGTAANFVLLPKLTTNAQ